ncbi:hypothetical protein NR798_34965 [Archangium gephyra]|uniref:hypothetical protein n=1 Tax=Archangium gephyra TaxID=48 RepID=UPI0035D51218
MLTVAVAGCSALSDLGDTADTAVARTAAILDEGLVGLQNNSADWQKVLRDTEAKLTSDTQSTIRNEVSNLLYRGIAATSAEVRCDADFVVSRMRLGLSRLKAELLGAPVPPLEPQLCSVIPLAVDRTLVAQGRLNHLALYGYDLDAGSLQVLLQDGGELLDVTDMLNLPTHYLMTLTLGGSTGVPITSSSQRLIIKWAGHELSTISVIQPETPLCRTQVVTYQPSALHFIPPKFDGSTETRGLGLLDGLLPGSGEGSDPGARPAGDADFSGHGPEVNARVRLINNGTSVSAELFMSAKETRADWSQAQGSRTEQLYVPDPGWRVTDMRVPSSGGEACPPQSTCFSYTDTTLTPDIFSAGSGPVQRFEFIGDTSGTEVGTRTGMHVTFNPLRFELTEDGNCVAPSTVSRLKSLDLIAPETLEQLAPEGR